MATVWTEVEVNVDLDDFEDDDLIDEIERRKYFVSEKERENFQDVIDWYKRGNTVEALVQLEKIIPELYGISGKVK
jgi:hypothetical protein